jgi:3',5'-cyclic-nucleotide phosphodiesterase
VVEPDAYRSALFDQRVDTKTGYHTRTVLAAPLFGARGNAVGCIELLNKTAGVFDEADCRAVSVFGLVCGGLIEASGLSRQIVELQEKVARLGRAANVRLTESGTQAIAAVVKEAHTALRSERSACYLAAGPALELAAREGSFPRQIENSHVLARVRATRQTIVDHNFSTQEIDGVHGAKTCSFIGAPLITSGGSISGVLMFLTSKPRQFVPSEVEFAGPFATFCSVAIETAEMRREHGNDEIAKWMSPSERESYEIPTALVLSPKEVATVCSMNCFAPDFKGIGHFKEIFYFFRTFNFFEQFRITAERFFRFLTVISSRYTDTSYHNWTHACDVTQCIFFMVSRGALISTYESWEIFTLFTAAVCHDTNHLGVNNAFNVKAETPLGILYKEQSVLEIHHVHESFPIIQHPDINLFGYFQGPQLARVWSLFIKIILATDMARHFDIVKRAHTALDEGTFLVTDPEFRLLDLQIIMKVGDISNVSRPFELADRWCDILNVEFFHQGDLEKEVGIGLTSPLNDRETSNKPKSQIGFYNFICIPLYTVLARQHPPLHVLIDSVRSNLDKWVDLAKQQS